MPIISNIANMSVWLSDHKRVGQPIGIEVSLDDSDDYTIVFSGPIPGDEFGYHGQKGDEGADVLRRLLDSKDYFKFVPYSIPEMSAFLYIITGLDPAIILPHFIGDMETVEFTIGRAHVPEESMIDEARQNLLEWRAVQQMEMPSYYRAVAEPLARIMALPPQEPTWQLDYPDLLMRVITKYSSEPLLASGILEEETPIYGRVTKRLQEVYENATHDMAYAAILWSALGGDSSYMAAQYPERWAELDGLDLKALAHNLDKAIPSVRLMATNTWQAGLAGFGPTRVFRTLYGRGLPLVNDPRVAQGPGMWLDHVLSGTVQDLKNVAAVSAANLGAPSVDVPIIRGDEDTITLTGTHGEEEYYGFVNSLKALATLGGPLAPTPLNPIITRLRGK